METVLELQNITKEFPGVIALDDVTFKLKKGEVMGLIGENGAGKSTLMKILGGVYTPTKGKITVFGQQFDHITPQGAVDLGIGFVHQELNLCNELSIAENVFLGRMPHNKLGVVDYQHIYDETSKHLKDLELELDPRTPVKQLSTGKKQMVEIIKSLSMNAKVIIFDEPTTSLTVDDVKNLFKIIKKLKKSGVSIVFVSHRLGELFEICDEITILRDGKYIDCVNAQDTKEEELIKLMVGRTLDNLFPREEFNVKFKNKLEVKNISDGYNRVKNASFEANSGEIIGFAGLVGAGRTELMRLILGADKIESGEVIYNGTKLNINSSYDAVNSGIAFVTEDRKVQGLVTELSIEENINLPKLEKQILNQRELSAIAINYKKILDIKTKDIWTKAKNLSGGNQQKVVIAKWLNRNSEIYIFDEPTKGIDVGAKREIYLLMNKLVNSGKIVIMISSDMQEIIGISNRIYVMCEGEITGQVDALTTNQEEIMQLATKGVE